MQNLFMIDLEGTNVSESEKIIVNHANVGAVVLFSRNFKNSEQLTQLVDEIKAIRPDVFIAVDHEGGYVQRFLRSGFRSIPSARSIGEVYALNPQVGIEYARKNGELMARDLIKRGIDLSLAPVLDLYGESEIIGGLDRAFHKDPDVVAVLAEAFIEGMSKGGMPAVCKHFPGHGSCLADSHIKKPVYGASLEQLRQTDLKPFKILIAKQKVDAIMPAHITYSAVDAENPAGFSKIWLETILRTELGFQGFILSDCLSMKGADIGDLKTRAEQAINAGCDMLIVCNQPRQRLLELLNTINREINLDSADRLRIFKQKMRSSSRHESSIHSSLAFTLMPNVPHSESESVISDDINRTNTI